MNTRLLELAQQVWPDPSISHVNHEKFAALIINECIRLIENMPPHCAHTTFQVSIVECAQQQAIDEIRKTFEVNDELVTP
jgi:hypothetical protein